MSHVDSEPLQRVLKSGSYLLNLQLPNKVLTTPRILYHFFGLQPVWGSVDRNYQLKAGININI